MKGFGSFTSATLWASPKVFVQRNSHPCFFLAKIPKIRRMRPGTPLAFCKKIILAPATYMRFLQEAFVDMFRTRRTLAPQDSYESRGVAKPLRTNRTKDP